MGPVLTKKLLPRYTVKDYERWDGDWELIEGVPYALASPSFRHQRVVGILFLLLELLLEEKEECKDCKAVIDTDYVVNEHTVLRPDIAIVCNHRGDKLTKPPKAVIEVVSPSTKKVDEEIKPLLYAEEGIENYILVYPEEERMVCLTLEGKKYREKPCEDSMEIKLSDGCTLKIDPKEVWKRI